MNKDRLMKYIRSVLVLEREVYEQEKLLDDIRFTRNKYTNPPQKELEGYYESGEEVFKSFIKSEAIALVLVVIGILAGKSILLQLLAICSGGAAIIVPFLCLKEWSDNKALNEKARHTNTINDSYNKMMAEKYKKAYDRANREYQAVNQNLTQTKKVLAQYYNMDIIYPKYKNFVCMASILDYFQSGICSQLTGHEGAYRILEEDMKFRRIEQKLDQITQNQYTMMSELRQAKQTISSMGNSIQKSMDAIMSNQMDANRRLDTISYNSEVQSRNTELIKDIEIYRLLEQKK